MAYTPTNWQDRISTNPGQFSSTGAIPGNVTLTLNDNPTQAGTPVTAANMNKIENELVVLDEASVSYAVDIGVANTYAVTLSPAPTAYYNGMDIAIKIANTNTGASTLNVNALGAKNLMKITNAGIVALSAGDIPAGAIIFCVYDGTQYVTNVGLASHMADTAPHGATALATANKIALRDANGNLSANQGFTLTSTAAEVGLSLSGNALPVGTALPPVSLVSGGYGIGGEVSGYMDILAPLGFNFIAIQNSTAVVSKIDTAGNLTVTGTVSASSGQLGSASGTWTPASGTFNVASGTVINVAAVPSGAKMYQLGTITAPEYYWGIGIATPNGSLWVTGNGGSSPTAPFMGFAAAISSTTVYGENFFDNTVIYDGSYQNYGYFQINNGYLQFVTLGATANSSSATTIRWGVS